MDLPGPEAAVTHERSRRRLVVAVVLACAVLGLAGVNAWAFGHGTTRVTAARHPAYPAAHPYPTTTTVPIPTTTLPVPTTTVPVPTTVVTAPPATAPPTTAAPPTTVAAVSWRVTPSTAEFPSTPPPYWPMPIVPVTITNTGGVAISSVVVHPVGVYSIPSNTCTTTLMPGQS